MRGAAAGYSDIPVVPKPYLLLVNVPFSVVLKASRPPPAPEWVRMNIQVILAVTHLLADAGQPQGTTAAGEGTEQFWQGKGLSLGRGSYFQPYLRYEESPL